MKPFRSIVIDGLARIIHHSRGISLGISHHSALASLTNTGSIRSVTENTVITNILAIRSLSGKLSRLALLLTVLFTARSAVAQELLLDSELKPLLQSYQPGQPLPPGVEPPPYYRYRSGDPLPKGYHVEERPTTGLLIAGYIVTGIPYAVGLVIALAAGFDNQSGWLLLPVAGPWVTLGARRRACDEIGDSGWDSAYCVGDRISEWFLGIDGIVQGIGGGLVALGLIITRPYAVRDEVSYVVTPSLVGNGYGFKAYGWW